MKNDHQFYQDRLGTNIREDSTLSKKRCAFVQWKNFNASSGACTMLDMLPVPTTACGPGCAYHGNTSILGRPAANSSAWGARVLPATSGGYIMAVAEGAYGCDFLATWRSNSQTALAVADSPTGPFRKLGVAVPPWSTNPALFLAPRCAHYHIKVAGQIGRQPPHVSCCHTVSKPSCYLATTI